MFLDGGGELMPALVGGVPLADAGHSLYLLVPRIVRRIAIVITSTSTSSSGLCCLSLGGLPAAPMPLLPEELVDRRAIICIAGKGGAAGLGASRQSQHRTDREEGEELPLEEVGWEGWSLGAEHVASTCRCTGYVTGHQS